MQKYAESGSTGGVPNRSLRNALAMQSLASADLAVSPSGTRSPYFDSPNYANSGGARSLTREIATSNRIEQEANELRDRADFLARGNDPTGGIQSNGRLMQYADKIRSLESHNAQATPSIRRSVNQDITGTMYPTQNAPEVATVVKSFNKFNNAVLKDMKKDYAKVKSEMVSRYGISPNPVLSPVKGLKFRG